ncbi:MAG: beta-lactamase family protein [Candidatus Thorarchaeota archaeon]|nr:beta-lactamase family protein [Candidatus Thorarchaeota archaeon]
MKLRVLQVFSFALLLLLTQGYFVYAESTAISPNIISYFPDDEWTATTPEEQGMTSSILDEMMQFIDDSDAPIQGLVVTRNGYIVKEQYWNYNTENSTHHIFSCTKSFTSTLIGIAIKEGFIDNVSQRVLDFFPEMTIENMDSRKGNMTLEHVLTMTTGLDWNEWNISYTHPDNMYNQMFSSPNPVQFFLNLPTAYDPGTHWVYTTGASHLLSAIIQQVTNMTTRDFAEEYLFEPLNMTIGGWNNDAQGINNGGTQLYVTVRTMAKLGLLCLNNGTWDGNKILTEEYVTQASTSHVYAQPDFNYGYQWWIDPTHDLYSARGSEGQYVFVSPEYNVVVAITARADEAGEDISETILTYIQQSLTDGFGGRLEILQIVAVAAIVLCVAVVAVLYKYRS